MNIRTHLHLAVTRNRNQSPNKNRLRCETKYSEDDFLLDVFLYTPAPAQSRTTYFDRSRNSHLHRRKNSPTHNTTEVDATIYTQSAILNGTTLNIVPPNETIRI